MKDTVLPTPFLTPALLRCSHYDGYTGEAARPESYAIRAVYEYELEYYIRSEGGIRVDGRYLPFSAGEINFRKPGQVVQGVPPMSVIFSLWIWWAIPAAVENLPLAVRKKLRPGMIILCWRACRINWCPKKANGSAVCWRTFSICRM